MNKQISVDQAIRKGHIMLTYPQFIISIGAFAICIYLEIQKIVPFWVIPTSFAISFFLLPRLYLSFMIIKWKIWAFENVRNVHELKRNALNENLIYRDGSFFEKLEIRTIAEKEKLKSLQAKFNSPDVFIDNAGIPNETIIYYPKKGSIYKMIFSILICAVGLFHIVKVEDPIWYSILVISGAYCAFEFYKKATSKRAQITINEKGIKTINTEFKKWSEISHAKVLAEKAVSNEFFNYYLIYDYTDGNEKLQIDALLINQKELENLLRVYRGRSEKSKSNGQL